MSLIEWDLQDDGILILRLNRPESLNALNPALIDALAETHERLAKTKGLRAIILTGAGRGFCAGYDLKASAEVLDSGGPGKAINGMRGQAWFAGLMTNWNKLKVPVIAAVNGPAMGGGFALSLAADIRIASPNAKFAAANIRIGVSAGECGMSWLLPRMIGSSRAFEILLTGRTVGAEEAERIGLVSRLVPSEDALMPAAVDLARQITTHAPFAVWMSKEVIWRNLDISSFQAALDLENRTQALCALTDDIEEASLAFREKRKARFREIE